MKEGLKNRAMQWSRTLPFDWCVKYATITPTLLICFQNYNKKM